MKFKIPNIFVSSTGYEGKIVPLTEDETVFPDDIKYFYNRDLIEINDGFVKVKKCFEKTEVTAKYGCFSYGFNIAMFNQSEKFLKDILRSKREFIEGKDNGFDRYAIFFIGDSYFDPDEFWYRTNFYEMTRGKDSFICGGGGAIVREWFDGIKTFLLDKKPRELS